MIMRMLAPCSYLHNAVKDKVRDMDVNFSGGRNSVSCDKHINKTLVCIINTCNSEKYFPSTNIYFVRVYFSNKLCMHLALE